MFYFPSVSFQSISRWVGFSVGMLLVFSGSAVQGSQIADPVDSEAPRQPQTQSMSQIDRALLNRPDLSEAAVLTDLTRFPLFLPVSVGLLTAASDRLSPVQISSPSLVWTQDKLGDRYGSDRLVEQWRAYSVSGDASGSLNYVDVIVNQRIWGLLSYFERYAFILQFGSAAKLDGYNLRVFHTGDVANFNDSTGASNIDFVTLRGAYLCPFDAAAFPLTAETAASLSCEVLFDSSSRRPRLTSPF